MAGKTRSPNYPGISLSEAMQRARALYEKERTAHIAPEVAVTAWGYNGLNGASARVLGAVRQYGLVEDVGRDVKVSARALAIILDPPGSVEFVEAIRAAAREPAIFGELLSEYPDGLPSEQGLVSSLVRKRGFTEDGARKLSAVLRDTMELVSGYERPNVESQASVQENLPAANESRIAGEASGASGGAPTPADSPPVPGLVVEELKIPLPSGAATLTYKGTGMTPFDVELLYMYLDVHKRRMEMVASQAAAESARGSEHKHDG